MKTILWVSIVLLGFHCGLQAGQLSEEASRALHAGSNTVLYSLDPSKDKHSWRTNNGVLVYPWKVLGKTSLSPQQAQTVAIHLEDAIEAGEKTGAAAKCFIPRHALRVKFDNQEYNFVICYECHRLDVMCIGRKAEPLLLRGSPDQLNAILTAAGVPLAQR